jgi:hypothetical protein
MAYWLSCLTDSNNAKVAIPETWTDDTQSSPPSGSLQLTDAQKSFLDGIAPWSLARLALNGNVLFDTRTQAVDNSGTVYTLPSCAPQYITTDPTTGRLMQMSSAQMAAVDAAVSVDNLKSQLEATDAAFIRVTEDLITALVAKGTIALTDLPAASQAKLSSRQALRKQISGS